MNLEESNEYIKAANSNNKKKKTVLGMIVFCIILIIGLVGVIVFIKLKDANTDKLYVDGTQRSFPSSTFVSNNGQEYVSINDFAQLAGYEFHQGAYKTYGVDENSCYIKNNFEVISFKVDNKNVNKFYISSKTEDDASNDLAAENLSGGFYVESVNETKEIFELNSKIEKANDKFYIPLENIERIFNVKYGTSGKKRIVSTLETLYVNSNAMLGNVNAAKNKNFAGVSVKYENAAALIDNIVIVINSENKYGVLNRLDYSTILDDIYSDITYIPSVQAYRVKVRSKNAITVGLLSKEGKVIIDPTDYDNLNVFDIEHELYIAQKEDEYVLLNKKATRVTDYFVEIGNNSLITNGFEKELEENSNLIEGKYVVVKSGRGYGLYSIEESDAGSNKLLSASYDSFGYVASKTDKSEGITSSLIIPKKYGVHGLIIQKNGYYGVYDLDAKEIVIPCSVKKIYSKVEDGKTRYYFEGDDYLYDTVEYFEVAEPAEYEDETEENQDEEEQQEDEELDEDDDENRDDDNEDDEDIENEDEEEDEDRNSQEDEEQEESEDEDDEEEDDEQDYEEEE